MPAADIITEKLIKMKKYLEELNSIKPADFNSYTQFLTTRYAVKDCTALLIWHLTLTT